MSKFLIDSFNQKFELRKLKVFFHANDKSYAEQIIGALDKACPSLNTVFGISEEPGVDVFLYPDAVAFERTNQRPLAMGEYLRIVREDKTLLMCSQQLPRQIEEEAGKAFALMIFDGAVKERELSPKQMRSPSWLRDGFCSQVSLKLRPDWNAQLLSGWTKVQEAGKKNNLIKPDQLEKFIGVIPDPERRELGFYQGFFMVRFLHTVYPEKFFSRYSTLMGAIEDMEAQNAFRQITGYDYDKFFSMFVDWVRVTNIWTAVSD